MLDPVVVVSIVVVVLVVLMSPCACAAGATATRPSAAAHAKCPTLICLQRIRVTLPFAQSERSLRRLYSDGTAKTVPASRKNFNCTQIAVTTCTAQREAGTALFYPSVKELQGCDKKRSDNADSTHGKTISIWCIHELQAALTMLSNLPAIGV
jgi:hypothetical protein